MDKMKSFVEGVTGKDHKLDVDDIKEQLGNLSLDDLKDLHFPISRNDLVSWLKENKASQLVQEAAEKLPDEMIQSINDLKSKLPF